LKWKPALILFIFIFSLIPIIPIEAQNTYWEFDLSGDSVYVGDRDSLEGKPVLELTRWKGEASFNIKFPGEGIISSMSLEGSTVKWMSDFIECHFYELPSTNQYEGGGFEFEIILKVKPPSNAYALPIDTENLVFHYQPPLNEELNVSGYDFVNATHAIINGTVVTHRPENVVGSYAVYHRSKRNNEYKTGKAFHIFRPLLIDDLGNEAWAELLIDKNSFMITLPQKFLDTAQYPVIVDPTFGKTDIGGTKQTWGEGYLYAHKFTLSEDGTVTQLQVYLERANEGNVKLGIYDNLRAREYGGSDIAIPSGTNWVPDTGLSIPLNAADFYLCWRINNTQWCFWDTVTDAREYMILAHADPWPDPFTVSNTDNMQVSIYATYTAAGGQTYERYPNQSISWSSSLDRTWSLSRGLTQSLTFTWTASGIHSAFEEFVRTITLAVNWASSIKRRVDFHRAFSQSITFTWNALGSKWGEWIRNLSLNINWTSSLKRRVDFHKMVSQSISFTLTLPGLIAQTLRVLVTNLNNLAIQNALVTVSYPSSGSIEFVQYTDAEGYTDAEILTGGNYTVMVVKEEYLPYNLLFTFSDTTILETSLTHVEDAITLNFNIELLIFTGIACVLSLYGWHNEDLDGMLAATIAFFTWFASGLWFMWTYAGTEQVHFWYLFELFALVSLMLAIRNTLHLMDSAGKKGAWSEY